MPYRHPQTSRKSAARDLKDDQEFHKRYKEQDLVGFTNRSGLFSIANSQTSSQPKRILFKHDTHAKRKSTTHRKDCMDILNKRFGLRSLLRNPSYRTREGSIPQTELTQDKEPDIRTHVARLVSYILEDPNRLLQDEYSVTERRKDWDALVKKDATTFDSRSRVGHNLLDHHMPHFWNVKNHKGISVSSLVTPESLEKACMLNIGMHTTPYKSEIRRTIVLASGMSSVTKYRAGISKAIVKRYNATSVLDPCIGWGGRMIGSLAAGATYTGCDPDPNTFRGLQGILLDIGKEANIHNSPAEEFLPTLSNNSVDLVLTSPPYYDLELYTAGDQSVKQNMTWEVWVDDWLKPVILHCLRCLRSDGKSCWSVKNFKTAKKYPLADVVRDIHTEQGWLLIETISVKGPGRPGAAKPSEEQTFVYARS